MSRIIMVRDKNNGWGNRNNILRKYKVLGNNWLICNLRSILSIPMQMEIRIYQ
jgi:hypothetical protein